MAPLPAPPTATRGEAVVAVKEAQHEASRVARTTARNGVMPRTMKTTIANSELKW